MTGAMANERLERGYRRLLGWYPARHRAEYGEEMLGVLMSGAAPGQSRPGGRESLDLVAHALLARVRGTLPDFRVPAWREACAAFGYLASLVVALTVLSPALGRLRLPASDALRPYTSLIVAGVWLVVAVAAGLGWRHVAAVAAVVAAPVLAVPAVHGYASDPGGLVVEWWRLVLAATAATALVLARRRAPRQNGGVRPTLGRWAHAALAIAGGLVCAAIVASGPAPTVAAAVYRLMPPDAPTSEFLYVAAQPPRFTLLSLDGWPPALMLAALVFACTVAVVLVRTAPLVRRRVLVLAAPAAIVTLLVDRAFNGFLVSTLRFNPPVYLVPLQWIVLFATPVLTLAAGVWLVARFERKAASGALLRYPGATLEP